MGTRLQNVSTEFSSVHRITSTTIFYRSPLASLPFAPDTRLWPDGQPVCEITERLASRFVLKVVAMLVLDIFLPLALNLFNSLFC